MAMNAVVVLVVAAAAIMYYLTTKCQAPVARLPRVPPTLEQEYEAYVKQRKLDEQ